jgi:hypothetical protein
MAAENRQQSSIIFCNGVSEEDLTLAMMANLAPLSKLVHDERRRIKVVKELVYQLETILICLGGELTKTTPVLRSLFAKGHKLVQNTRTVMKKVQPRLSQVPNTCSCECRVYPASVTKDFDELVAIEDAIPDTEYDREGVPHCF